MLWDEPKIFFLERRYFFSIILSEFLKNRVALHTEFPDIESYIWFLQSNVIRTTGMDCPLPDGDVETQAQAMFRHLDRIGGLRLLED